VSCRSFEVTIHGRVDGVYQVGSTTTIEEIKSVLSLDHPLIPEQLPSGYILQLQAYLYLWQRTHPDSLVTGRLVLVCADPQTTIQLQVSPDFDLIESMISDRVERIIAGYQTGARRQALRAIQAERIVFPFPKLRRNQDRMIEAIETSLSQQRSLMISAPTGIGKTSAALYATMRYATKHGLSVFFLTAKTTQQRIVADTLALWNQGSAADMGTPPAFTSLLLRSKEKICANDVVFCHESRCLYAKDFFGKLRASGLQESLLSEPLITPERVYAEALKQELCPFELSLEMLSRVDLTVCDYNYVYDPQIAIQCLKDRECGRTIVIIDEAHNLYSRARDYFSPSIEFERIRNLRLRTRSRQNPGNEITQTLEFDWGPVETGVGSFVARLDRFLEKLEDQLAEIEATYLEVGVNQQVVVSFDKGFFRDIRNELDDVMKSYLVCRKQASFVQSEDEILELCYSLNDFCRVLEKEGDEFVHILSLEGRHPQLKIVCLDPASQLKTVHEKFYSVIAMSATLSPMEFYRDVIGFNRDTALVELPSPFPPENRKMLVVPEVSTTYRNREKHFSKIARTIEEIISIRKGNYFAFFPSFRFLESVVTFLTTDEGLLVQRPFMSDSQRADFLEQLADPVKAHLVFAVQGGIFAEGVDYPGELAIGAIIVGPGLPKVSFELELMRSYYEQNYSQGFEYAYLYPGMNRVIQSAGRIVRSETDRGIIVLLDQRFAHENYTCLFPRHWYDASAGELISWNYCQEIKDFWYPTDQVNGLSMPTQSESLSKKIPRKPHKNRRKQVDKPQSIR